MKPVETKATYTLTSADADRLVGQWANDTNGVAVTISRGKDGLLLGRTPLFAQSAMKFVTAGGETLELDARGFRHDRHVRNGGRVREGAGQRHTPTSSSPRSPAPT